MTKRKWKLHLVSAIALTVAVGVLVLGMRPASLGSAASLAIAPLCTAAGAQAAAPPGVKVGPVNDLNPNMSAVPTAYNESM